MTETFYISDTHFGHTNVLKFEKKYRPFKTIEEHDEELITRWNRRVGKRDVVVHLGDVAFRPNTVLDQVMPLLNGIKKLVIGNHDHASIDLYLKYFTKVRSCIEDKGNGIIFSHYPIHPSQLEFRYGLNVHGHVHHNSLLDPRYVNISCEVTELGPVTLDEILQMRDKNHRNEVRRKRFV